MPIPSPIARHRRARTVRELRLAVECLPLGTREAMLAGVRETPRIIVGAYTDGEGGVCPMLAAHRRGGRTNFLSFARSWDRFTGVRRRRPASARELHTLIALLEGSLLDEERVDLGGVIAEHAALRRRREREQADPTGEIVARRLRVPRWMSRREPVAG
ncbi:MAG TPA: hypothetical protein VNV37_06455 [Solirubrobacteraceae bacterium]|jgi:hypothetical protein|nr:hypothetical protein [Solirubrobacteraceae bacterium]